MRSFLQELSNSLRNNKLRTFLTGFTIAWGIIILVVMLGAGKGVEHGIREMAIRSGAGQSEVSISMWTTGKPYAGYKEGRQLELTPSQFSYLQGKYASEILAMTPTRRAWSNIASEHGEVFMQMKTLDAIEQSFNKLELQEGRLFTLNEHQQGKRVVVISDFIISSITPKGMSAVGLTVTISGVSYEVVGVVKSPSPFFGVVYMPLSTQQMLYPNRYVKLKEFKFFPRSSTIKEQNDLIERMQADIRSILKVDPTDEHVFSVDSSMTNAEVMDKIFRVLTILLWVMGIGSLGIGTIGVSNIMHVTIQERSREIGIRKAIGAKPRDIMALVLGESLLLSLVAGVVGLIIGTGIVQLMGYASRVYHWGEQVMPVEPTQETTLRLFVDPEVNLSVAIGALIVLIIAGLIAGYGPAKKAIRIPAVIAMREQK